MDKIYKSTYSIFNNKIDVREYDVKKETPKQYQLSDGLFAERLSKELFNSPQTFKPHCGLWEVKFYTTIKEDGLKLMKEHLQKRITYMKEQVAIYEDNINNK